MLYSLRSTHTCFRLSFDDITRINFRFLLLVTLSLRMAVMHLPIKFGADIFIHSGVRHFSEIENGGRRHLGFSVYVNLATPASL